MHRRFTLALGIAAAAAAAALSVATPVDRVDDAAAETVAADTGGLAPYLDAAASPFDSAGIGFLARGIALRARGEAAAAAAAFDSAGRRLPGLRDWAAFLAAEAAADAGDVAGVHAALAATEPGLAAARGWEVLVRAQRRARDPVGARATAERAALLARDPVRHAAALLRTASLALVLGDTASATASLRLAMRLAPRAGEGAEAARALAGLRSATADDGLRIARLYLANGNRRRGIEGLLAYLDRPGRDPVERQRARLDLADARLADGDYRRAVKGALAVAAGPASPALGARALVLAGRARYRHGQATAARAVFRDAARRFPREPATAEALFFLGDFAHDAGRIDEARGLYDRTIAVDSTSDVAGEAAMRLGGLALVSGDAARAARAFDACRRTHRTGDYYARASYWAGRAYLRADDTARAADRFREALRADPISFHAMRAADHLPDVEWRSALAPAPATAPGVGPHVVAGLRRLDVLRALGLDDGARLEIARLRTHLAGREGGAYALAEALRDRGEIALAVRLGRDIRRDRDAWDERLLRIVYPFPLRSTVVAEARRHGLDPALVAGLIRQESLFNPRAVSSAGAVGLMQILPSTGRALARSEGIRPFSRSMLREPDVNIRLGTRFVADLLGSYGGSLAEMLSAYNAGSGRLDRWRAQPEHDDAELFVERIPFPETREYVRTVQQNARIYAAIYPDDDEDAASALR